MLSWSCPHCGSNVNDGTGNGIMEMEEFLALLRKHNRFTGG